MQECVRESRRGGWRDQTWAWMVSSCPPMSFRSSCAVASSCSFLSLCLSGPVRESDRAGELVSLSHTLSVSLSLSHSLTLEPACSRNSLPLSLCLCLSHTRCLTLSLFTWPRVLRLGGAGGGVLTLCLTLSLLSQRAQGPLSYSLPLTHSLSLSLCLTLSLLSQRAQGPLSYSVFRRSQRKSETTFVL